MNVIEIDASPRISIVRAKELILAALPTEKYAEVYFYVAANGQPDLEGEHQIKMAEGKFATPYMELDLPEIFEELNIIPRMIFRPNIQEFRKGHEILYNISQQEFVRLAAFYNLDVNVNVAKPNDGELCNASGSASKRWTSERLGELEAYRDSHTMPETADKFGISEQRIRQLLPKKSLTPKGNSVFTHRIK
jgi:hypothetical protein